MKKKTSLVAGLVLSLGLIGSGNLTYASEIKAPNPIKSIEESGKPFLMEIDLEHLNDQLNKIQNLIVNETNEDKLMILKDAEESLIRELRKVKNLSVNDMGTFGLNDNYYSFGKGDVAYNSNFSSAEPNHFTSLNLALSDVKWSGFDWNGRGRSAWVGTPSTVYSIKNTITLVATGVNITGNLGPVSLGGVASGSASIENENPNHYDAVNSFDAFTSGSTVRVAFTSSSEIKKTSTGKKDSTSTQITIYNPHF